MKVCLVGYGYYSVGSGDTKGGTIVAGILRWIALNPSAPLSLSIVCYDESSRDRLELIARDILSRATGVSHLSQLEVKIETEHEVARQQFDAAIISSPEHTHLHYLRLLSANASKILCVKPVGSSLDDVQIALALQQQTGVEIYVEFHKRFDLANKQFVRHAKAGASRESRFHFQYGQKSEVPLEIFKKWAHRSNPFQYLAPHYLDLMFQALELTDQEVQSMELEGSVNSIGFAHQPSLRSLVSVSLSLTFPGRKVILDASCSWMEPTATPYPSRQVFEFQSNNTHLVSDQDRRGQRFITAEGYSEPNPYFHIDDSELFADGYGPKSVEFFLDSAAGSHTAKLATLVEYVPVAKVLDFVNERLASEWN